MTSNINVQSLAHVRMRAPDLDAAETFLTAFGLATVVRADDHVVSRGTDAGPPCHIVEKGDAGFISAAFTVASEEQLEAAARLPGASAIERNSDVEGGYRVRLADPNGFRIDILQGFQPLALVPVDQFPINSALGRKRRDGEFYRRPPGPARVKRLGHFVLGTPDVIGTRNWYRETLGLLGTDDVFVEREDNIVATFSRLSRGTEYVDHHVFMAHRAPLASLNHLGFEVQDFDDIFFGHYFLKEAGREHKSGFGRHRLGSQVYNQWSDPWGRNYEHWTDTDVLNHEHPLTLVPASIALKSQWGDPPAARLV